MNRLQKLLHSGLKPVIGMVHLGPTLSSFRYSDPHSRLEEAAVAEASLLAGAGVHALLLENMSDVPYQRQEQAGAELTASMSAVAHEVRRQLPQMAIGVQLLSGCNLQALAVAKACDLDFVRCEGFVFGHVGDEGWTQSCAAELCRYRRQLQADAVWLLADVKKKHSSHAVTADVSLRETADAAAFFLADAVVVTGRATGCATQPQDVDDAAGAQLPVFVGSGVSAEQLRELRSAAGFIVGSAFKENNDWRRQLVRSQILLFMQQHRLLFG